MNLIYPMTFTHQPLILIISPQFSYTDNSLQLVATVSINFGFFFNLKKGEEATINVPDFVPQIKSQYENYNKVRHFLNICANTGEAVDDSLLQLLEKMIPERKVEFAKMDFMKRRDEFSVLFNKSEVIKKLPEFDSKSKRKVITTTFTQFITLRNYYTHGKLILKYNSGQYYIQVIDKPTGIKTTYEINRDILTSFLNTGTEIINLISIISKNI